MPYIFREYTENGKGCIEICPMLDAGQHTARPQHRHFPFERPRAVPAYVPPANLDDFEKEALIAVALRGEE